MVIFLVAPLLFGKWESQSQKLIKVVEVLHTPGLTTHGFPYLNFDYKTIRGETWNSS